MIAGYVYQLQHTTDKYEIMQFMDDPFRQQNARLGKGMIYLAWIVIFGLLVWFFGIAETHRYNPNQKVQTNVLDGGQKEVVLKSGRHGHYVAGGRINGEKVTFLVDTGASYVSVPQHVADRAGLRRGQPHTATTANGTVVVYATTLDSVSIGDITLYDVKASINPGMWQEEVLLGMSFLRHLSVTHSDDRLTIRQ